MIDIEKLISIFYIQKKYRVIMQVYGFVVKTMTESSCIVELMKMYQGLAE